MVRVLVLLGSIYSTLWLVGLYAGMKMYPHRLTADGLRLYQGLQAGATIPYTQIAAVEAGRRKWPGGKDSLPAVCPPRRGLPTWPSVGAPT